MLTSSEIKEYIDNINDENELTKLYNLVRHREKEISDLKWEKVEHLFKEMMEKAREINEVGFDITLDGDIIDIDDLRLEAL